VLTLSIPSLLERKMLALSAMSLDCEPILSAEEFKFKFFRKFKFLNPKKSKFKVNFERMKISDEYIVT